MRDSFVFYRSFAEAARMLEDTERLRLLDALIGYALDEAEPELEGALAGMMTLMQPLIDKNNQRFQNGKKGGRPAAEKPNRNQTETKPKPNRNQTKTTPEPNEDEDVNEDVHVNDNEEEDGAHAFVLADGSNWYPDSGKIKEFEKAFPNVNVKVELLRSAVKHNSTDRRKNVTNIERYVVNWLINAQADAEKARSGTFADMQQHAPVKTDELMKELRGRGNLV